MREQLEHLLLVLAVGTAVAIGAKRVFVPYNVALVIVGLLLVFTDVLPKAPMDPEVVLLAFLPVLVFEGALFADAKLKSFDFVVYSKNGPNLLVDVKGRSLRNRASRSGSSPSTCWLRSTSRGQRRR